jgi:hypothetical protein
MYPHETSASASIGFGRFTGSLNSNAKSLAVSTGASFSMRASAFTRLCACFAFDAFALKRSMKCCSCAMRSCWRENAACCCDMRSARIASKAL